MSARNGAAFGRGRPRRKDREPAPRPVASAEQTARELVERYNLFMVEVFGMDTLSVPTAARILGRSEGEVYYLVKTKRLFGGKVGGRWRVDAESVADLLDAQWAEAQFPEGGADDDEKADPA